MTILTLFLTLALMTAGWLWLDVGRSFLARLKTQTHIDMTALSSLRVRGESLRAIADRWQEWGIFLGRVEADGSVFLESARWALVEKEAAELKKALPSYQGRSTAVLTVVADANGFDRDRLQVVDAGGSALGLAAEPLTVRDEKGRRKTIQGGWLRRTWGTDDPEKETRHALDQRLNVRSGDPWTLRRGGVAKLEWDVSADPAARASGNGGYPKSWPDALRLGRLEPHRYPFYKARLREAGE